MKMRMHQYTDKNDHFLITAPTFKILKQSTLLPFLDLMEGLGHYNRQEEMFEMYGGGRCFFRTETDPDSIVGITNIRHIWGDEAGKYRLYFWQNMQARADSKGAGTDLTTSPYALNWIYTDIYRPWKQGLLSDDWTVIQAASWESPYHFLHDPKERAKKRATMDPRRFNMIYGGEFGRMEGLVYDCWDDSINFVDPFALPPGTRFFGGIDWGYNPDPWVLKIRAVTPSGQQYGLVEYVKTRDTISDIKRVLEDKKRIWGVELFIADPSQPGYIEELNRAGLSTIGADNDIRLGVDRHYELIKTGRYREFRGTCPHSADEREQYHYPEPKDLKPDQDAKATLPVDQHNHCMDVDRYLTMYLHNLRVMAVPVAKKRPMTESEFLRRPEGSHQTESWSHDHDL